MHHNDNQSDIQCNLNLLNIMRLSIRTPNMMTLCIMKLNMTTLGMADKNVLANAAIKNVILVERMKESQQAR